jgi:hypothetical protein
VKQEVATVSLARGVFGAFVSRCATLDRSNISFSLYKFNYLHQNLTLPPIEGLNSTTDFDSNIVVNCRR